MSSESDANQRLAIVSEDKVRALVPPPRQPRASLYLFDLMVAV